MVINYSKWDALELSDDSDVEVHPNVDKKSFIRAKQAQIHQERERRRHQIKTLKYERIINDGLMLRIDRLLTALKSHKDNASANADQLVLQSLIESAGDPAEDRPPPPPEGVHEHIKDKPTYSKMMAALVDQVKKEVDDSKAENRLDKFIDEIGSHRARVEGLQKELYAKLAELEKEEQRHITSDDIHEGFSYSNVAKHQPSSTPASSSQTKSVELLNPPRPDIHRSDTGQSSGADADVEEGTAVDDGSVEASPLGKKFARVSRVNIRLDEKDSKLKHYSADYSALLQFVMKNPQILNEKESDGLMVEALNSAIDGKIDYARQCVHQSLLATYGRAVRLEGIPKLFRLISDEKNEAHQRFYADFATSSQSLIERAEGIVEERKPVEQIQLHAVDPNTTINIVVPPPVSALPADLSPEQHAAQVQAREIFDTFPPGLQRALESAELDEVNKVLAKMSVDEAEEVVAKLSEGGMLSLEEGVIDATTEEGKKAMEEIERTGRMPGERDATPMEGLVEETELASDPE